MVDKSKRRTIKLISGAGAATIGGAAFASATAFADATASLKPDSEKQFLFSDQLKIQITSGDSSPENTVILINDTNKKIIIREFLPAFVTYEDHMMDLNSLCKNEELTILPGYPVANSLVRWEPLALTPSSSYLWADNAKMALKTPHFGVISINAAVVNGQALLTLDDPTNAAHFS